MQFSKKGSSFLAKKLKKIQLENLEMLSILSHKIPLTLLAIEAEEIQVFNHTT